MAAPVASLQLLWCGSEMMPRCSSTLRLFDSALDFDAKRALRLGEMLPNDSTLEASGFGPDSLLCVPVVTAAKDWFVEPGLVVLNVVPSHKEIA